MEKYKKGGYTILDLESSTIYADSVKALDSNKPVVVYDGTNKPYFADTIVLDGTSVVITKGGKTITIANDNTVTSDGDIQNHLYELVFEYADDRVSFLTSTKFENYSFNMDNLTSDDVNYIKSLKGKLSLIGSGYADGDDDQAEGRIVTDTNQLYLKFNATLVIEFNLDNPENTGEDGVCSITCNLIF